jgi:predicted nucleic acid-binding protein
VKAVIDASVAMPYVHAEESSAAVRRWLARWVAVGSTLVAPHHFWLEIVNSLARRHRYSGTAILEAVHDLRQLPIESVELDEPAIILVIDAVERHALSAYDAQYLVLAEQLDVSLVTLDRRLAETAGSRAIDPTGLSPRLSETPAAYGSAARVTWPDYSGAASYLASLRAQLRDAQSRGAATTR